MMKKKNLVILGTVVGAGVAISTFFATKKGKEMRKNLLKKVDDMQAKMNDIEMSDVKKAITTKLDEIKDSISEFDWETPKEELADKYLEFKDKINVIKDHIELAKINIETKIEESIEDIEEEIEENFTLEIDATKE